MDGFSNKNKGLEIVMTNVAVVFHSGFGHTQAVAEAVARGAGQVPGVKASLVRPVRKTERLVV